MENITHSNHLHGRGGARPGSGRKPISEGKRRDVTISLRVRESTRDAIQKLRSQGVDINSELEKMIAELIDINPRKL